MRLEKRREHSNKGIRAPTSVVSEMSMLAKSKRSTSVLTSVIDGNMGLKSKRSTRDFAHQPLLTPLSQKRSQAAMEFLMTYGWAILAAIIVIAVLAIYFRPGNLVQNQCILSAPFNCYAGVVSTNGITLEVKNGAGQSLKVQMVEVDGCGTYTPNPIIYPGGLLIADQSLTTFVIDCILESGDKFQGDITITYIKIGSGLALTSPGTIAGTVLGDDVGGAVCTDSDGDKYNVTALGCGIADCDDTNINVNPGATEICGNGIDEDCVGGDAVCSVQCNDLIDNDGDTFIDMGDAGCSSPSDDDENNCGNAICESGEITSCPGDCTGGVPLNGHYITTIGNGNQNGSDWSNSWSIATINWASVQPGDIVYLAGGDYGATILDVNIDGTPAQDVIIKKATASETAGVPGWQASYANVALFNEISLVGDNYVTLDGAEWGGIKITKGQTIYTGQVINVGSSTDTTIRNVELAGPIDLCNTGRALAVGGDGRADNLVLDKMYIHDFIIAVRLENHNGILIQNSDFIGNNNPPAGCTQHGEDVAYFGEIDNIVLRNNKFYRDDGDGDALNNGDSLSFAGRGAGILGKPEIYNNAWYNIKYAIYENSDRFGGDGTNGSIEGMIVRGNTFAFVRTAIAISTISVDIENNLFCNLDDFMNLSTGRVAYATGIANPNAHSGNAFCFDSRYAYPFGTDGQVIPAPVNPFVFANSVNPSAVDLHLTLATNPVTVTFPSPYNTDLDGTSRGSDGTWDRGAYEF